jgi:hypothetical protein
MTSALEPAIVPRAQRMLGLKFALRPGQGMPCHQTVAVDSAMTKSALASRTGVFASSLTKFHISFSHTKIAIYIRSFHHQDGPLQLHACPIWVPEQSRHLNSAIPGLKLQRRASVDRLDLGEVRYLHVKSFL